ncbi:MAG: hypothetical protein WC157_01470 [Candidatus Paceibacterota bacterium]
MKTKWIKKTGLLVLLGLLPSFSVFARKLNIDWPKSPMGTDITTNLVQGGTNSLADLTQYLYEWGISIGALLAFISIIYAGFTYLTSAGNSNKLTESKERIKASFLGLALLLGTYLILNTINPKLVQLDISPDIFTSNPLENQSFISYEITSKCAFAKLYKDGKASNQDKNSGYKDIKGPSTGVIVEVGKTYKKADLFKIDTEVYNAVKFFSTPTVTEVKTTYTTDPQGRFIADRKERVITPTDPEYSESLANILIEDHGNYYIESMGTDCKLYFYYERNCVALADLWGGVANVSYPIDNIADFTTADPERVMCFKLVEN